MLGTWGPMPPRVSVIIPAHNAAGFLPETLDSVLAQTFADYEVVVADDASGDGTAALAAGYDERVRCVRSEVNVGPAGARNLAVAEAGGELLALLDADDLWLPEYLAEQVALYDREQRRRPGVGIVACDAYLLAPGGRRAQTWAASTGAVRRPTLTNMLRTNSVFVSAIVPRELVVELGGFSIDCWGSEDHDLWLRVLETGRRVVVNPRPLAVYRVAEGSVSANVLGMARTTQTTYDRALARGRLTRWQRLVARRYRRVQVAVELWQRLSAHGRASPGALLRATPTFALVVLEHPNRWLRWARIVAGVRRGDGLPTR